MKGTTLLDYKSYCITIVIMVLCRGVDTWVRSMNKINPEIDPCTQLIFDKDAQNNSVEWDSLLDK